jgi:hypothetical protein
VNKKSRAVIRDAYLAGEPLAEIAGLAGVTEAEADTYLTWWLSEGAPGAVLPGYGDGQDWS